MKTTTNDVKSTKGGLTMNINDYALEVSKGIEGATPCEVEKANGVICHGVAVPTNNGTIKANIYIDECYDAGYTIDDARAHVMRVMRTDAVQGADFNIDWIYDYAQVIPHLTARLYNKSTSADVFKSADVYGFSDLIIVPYVNIDNLPNGAGGVIVTNELVKTWNVTPDEVIEMAEQNAQATAKLQSMSEILAQFGMPVGDGFPMWVLTNDTKCYGAYAIIAKLDELKAKFKDGFTVLPSSVHEVIIVTEKDEALSDLVRCVNGEQVRPDEQLSDHAYIFS